MGKSGNKIEKNNSSPISKKRSKPEPVSLYKCQLCSDRFIKAESLERHMMFHKGEKSYKCDYCDKKFGNRLKRKAHVTKVHQIKLYNCDFCTRSFILKSRLLIHLKLHQSDQKTGTIKQDHEHMSRTSFKRKCPTCEQLFIHKTRYNDHLLWHDNPNVFACSVCHKQFKRRTCLTKHKPLHEKKKEFSCEFCGKEFTRFDALNVHLRNHTGERPYKCEECLELFATSGQRLLHLCPNAKAPEKKQPKVAARPKVQCKICLKYIASRANLKEHMNVHSGLKPLSCKYCSMKFRYRTMVSSHVRNRHPERVKIKK